MTYYMDSDVIAEVGVEGALIFDKMASSLQKG